VTTSVDGKKVYSADFLLSFQSRCTDKPANLPPMNSWVASGGGDAGAGAGGGGGGRGGRNNSARGGGRGGRGAAAGGRGGSPSGADRRGGRRNERGGRAARTPGGYQSTSTGPVEPLAQSDTRWQRPADVAEDDAVLQRVTGLLNKLTFERFDSITEKIVNAGVSTPELLHSVIGLIFDKALMEPKFSRMYAYLCANLDDSMPQFDVPGDDRKETFRRGLLQKCQREFATPPDWSRLDGLEGDERQELEFKMKLRVMGNVQFIGELHNRQLLPESVMHQCGRELIGNDLNEPDEGQHREAVPPLHHDRQDARRQGDARGEARAPQAGARSVLSRHDAALEGAQDHAAHSLHAARSARAAREQLDAALHHQRPEEARRAAPRNGGAGQV
jgi:hypothetical protein